MTGPRRSTLSACKTRRNGKGLIALAAKVTVIEVNLLLLPVHHCIDVDVAVGLVVDPISVTIPENEFVGLAWSQCDCLAQEMLPFSDGILGTTRDFFTVAIYD